LHLLAAKIKRIHFSEFQSYSIRQTKVYKDFGELHNELTLPKVIAYGPIIAAKALLNDHATAIKQYTITAQSKATALDYNGLGYSFLMTKQFGKSN
jgi:hypothetical protein